MESKVVLPENICEDEVVDYLAFRDMGMRPS